MAEPLPVLFTQTAIEQLQTLWTDRPVEHASPERAAVAGLCVRLANEQDKLEWVIVRNLDLAVLSNDSLSATVTKGEGSIIVTGITRRLPPQ